MVEISKVGSLKQNSNINSKTDRQTSNAPLNSFEAANQSAKAETKNSEESISKLQDNESLLDEAANCANDESLTNQTDKILLSGPEFFNSDTPLGHLFESFEQELVQGYPDIISDNGSINLEYVGELLQSNEIGEHELNALVLTGNMSFSDLRNLYESGNLSMDYFANQFVSGVFSSADIAHVFGQYLNIAHNETGKVELEDGTQITFFFVPDSWALHMSVQDSEGNVTDYKESLKIKSSMPAKEQIETQTESETERPNIDFEKE